MSARLDQITEVILTRFKDEWLDPDDASKPRTPFAFGNEALDPPDGYWVRLWVRSVPGQQETLGRVGNRRYNRPGFVIGDIRSPPGQGQGGNQRLGEHLRDIFEGIRLGPYDLRFGVLDIQDVGEIEDGRWWASTAECRFEYEDFR
jgi:hypothetical protein